MRADRGHERRSTERRSEAPWHLACVGSLFLLIYSVGVYDWINVQIGNLDYMRSIGVDGRVVGYFSNYPSSLTVLWTINVLGGPVAAVALLLRRKWAVWAALAVVIAKFSLDVLTFLFRDRWGVSGPSASIVDLTVLLISVGFSFYCRAMARRGFLS